MSDSKARMSTWSNSDSNRGSTSLQHGAKPEPWMQADSDSFDDVPPPAYGEIAISQDGVRTQAQVTDDGRVDIFLNEKSGRISNFFAPALEQQLETVQQEQQQDARTRPHVPLDQPSPISLNVVIHVVGSRGDVQPFVALALVLKNTYKHRVRLATHPVFKDFVEKNGLEFFSIGGDPAALMAFMVKNPTLMPSMKAVTEGDIGRRRQEMTEIMEGCWRSCIEPGDGMRQYVAGHYGTGDHSDRPFLADAIIANPPSFAHIHIAEKLGIPLHIMFTMPWSPTTSFPHPMANIKSSNANPKTSNFVSYSLIEMMTWQGLGDLINRFRVKALGLEPLSSFSATGMLTRLKIPVTYCWSPALIPKPPDWGPFISITGFCFLGLATSYTPDPELAQFLAAGPPPIYIGFGSIVVDDPNGMTRLIFEAVAKTGQRALVSKGWGGLGASIAVPPNVFLIGNCPHDWLFQRVSCVVHHGGAGTTAAGIALDKPTVVVPFFGDQPFWGSMIKRAGAGPAPIPHKQLTADRLAEAILEALTPGVVERARELGNAVRHEDGAKAAAQSFQEQLDIDQFRCNLFPSAKAVWKVKKSRTRLSALAATVLGNAGMLNMNDLRPVRIQEYVTAEGALDPLSGGMGALAGSIGNLALGILDLPYQVANSIMEPHREGNAAASAAPSGATTSSPAVPGPVAPASVASMSVLPGPVAFGSVASRSVTSGSVASGFGPRGFEERRPSSPVYASTVVPDCDDGDTFSISQQSSFSGKSKGKKKERKEKKSSTKSFVYGFYKEVTGKDTIAINKTGIAEASHPFGYDQPKDSVASDAARGAGRGMGRIVEAGLKTPLDFTMGIAKGFRNAPRLYGDDTVRQQEKITGFQSGVRTATKELGFGLYDGITGIVTQPLRGAKRDGVGGFFKGVGKGLGGAILKPGAALWGIPAYSFKGVYEEVQKAFGSSLQSYIVATRYMEGHADAQDSTEEQRQEIIKKWNDRDARRPGFMDQWKSAQVRRTGDIKPEGTFPSRSESSASSVWASSSASGSVFDPKRQPSIFKSDTGSSEVSLHSTIRGDEEEAGYGKKPVNILPPTLPPVPSNVFELEAPVEVPYVQAPSEKALPMRPPPMDSPPPPAYEPPSPAPSGLPSEPPSKQPPAASSEKSASFQQQPAPASTAYSPAPYEPPPASFQQQPVPAPMEYSPAPYGPPPASFQQQPAPASTAYSPAPYEPPPASFQQQPVPAPMEYSPAPYGPPPASFQQQPAPTPTEYSPAPYGPPPVSFQQQPAPVPGEYSPAPYEPPPPWLQPASFEQQQPAPAPTEYSRASFQEPPSFQQPAGFQQPSVPYQPPPASFYQPPPSSEPPPAPAPAPTPTKYDEEEMIRRAMAESLESERVRMERFGIRPTPSNMI